MLQDTDDALVPSSQWQDKLQEGPIKDNPNPPEPASAREISIWPGSGRDARAARQTFCPCHPPSRRASLYCLRRRASCGKVPQRPFPRRLTHLCWEIRLCNIPYCVGGGNRRRSHLTQVHASPKTSRHRSTVQEFCGRALHDRSSYDAWNISGDGVFFMPP